MLKAENNKYILEVLVDEDAENPRTTNDCYLGTMVCSHRRYTLGDKQFDASDYKNWAEVKRGECGKDKDIIALPLWLYDHSGLSIATHMHGYHGAWDCGQVGLIYVTKDKVRKEYGVKKVSKKLHDKVVDILKSEVETYNDYISGNVYGFRLTNKETDEEIDSCWGFYGSDMNNNGIAECLLESISEAEAKELVKALN